MWIREPSAQTGTLHAPVVDMEDVDDEAVVMEPDARVCGDPVRMRRGRQGGRLERPAGRGHCRGTRESDTNAQQRPAHAKGRYASIMS